MLLIGFVCYMRLYYLKNLDRMEIGHQRISRSEFDQHLLDGKNIVLTFFLVPVRKKYTSKEMNDAKKRVNAYTYVAYLLILVFVELLIFN